MPLTLACHAAALRHTLRVMSGMRHNSDDNRSSEAGESNQFNMVEGARSNRTGDETLVGLKQCVQSEYRHVFGISCDVG